MNIRCTVAVLALTLLLWTSVGLADDGTVAQSANFATNDAYLSRIDALERELAELQAQVDEAKGDAKDDCCGTSNWYAGFDFAILQPHFGAVEANIFGVGVDLLPDFDYVLAPRVWLAYDNPNGLGVRVSYWQFDNQTRRACPTLKQPPGPRPSPSATG
jgi:uncharacterized protein (UPF0335 family)